MYYGLVITAAGTASRFGQNKLFLDMNGTPLLVRSCEAFLSFSQITEWVLVLNEDSKTNWGAWVEEHPFPKPIRIVNGASQRQESVRNGVEALSNQIDKVIIHDAARPYIKPDLIDRLLTQSQKSPAVICGVPVTDTIKQVGGNQVIQTLKRDELVAVQTPQVFDRSVLLAAYQTADMTQTFTDDASILESIGIPVSVVAGDPGNVKITVPSDI